MSPSYTKDVLLDEIIKPRLWDKLTLEFQKIINKAASESKFIVKTPKWIPRWLSDMLVSKAMEVAANAALHEIVKQLKDENMDNPYSREFARLAMIKLFRLSDFWNPSWLFKED